MFRVTRAGTEVKRTRASPRGHVQQITPSGAFSPTLPVTHGPSPAQAQASQRSLFRSVCKMEIAGRATVARLHSLTRLKLATGLRYMLVGCGSSVQLSGSQVRPRKDDMVNLG